ncbi:LOW QUALITY PROTEIN: hypothetical protein Tsubulata_003040 [Turnera subulata]|uniref:Serine aminopeptidase S33 domain-containing protein n=1 Tax=Turnera subulata TaxID=218843 RepID=A0A9Q0G1Y8_9ROSI|nr:LOW QUALITY PROTEIN: hypothetical protein Tsubulata_003040 [Turnera subulata]
MAASAGSNHFAAVSPKSAAAHHHSHPPADGWKLDHPIRNPPTRRFSVPTEHRAPAIPTTTDNATKSSHEEEKKNPYENILEVDKAELEGDKKRLRHYFEEAKDMVRSDGGPPRWFSPLECGSRLDKSPLLLFLPGIDGVGLGLVRQYHTLGKIFDIWCLHIPVMDRTSFAGLLKMVERTVRSESCRSPNRPIYLVGESLGACLALAVAAANPDVDLQLILANPATSFEKSQLISIMQLLELIPGQYNISLPYILRLMTEVLLKLGDLLWMAMVYAVKGIPLQQTVEGLSQDVISIPSYLHGRFPLYEVITEVDANKYEVLGDILPRETLLWKLNMLKSASSYANSRLHTVTAQTFILSSSKDQLLPSQEEGQGLPKTLKKCVHRSFSESGHFLFLEDDIDLVTVIKQTYFYRRGKQFACVADYIPPTPLEFKNIYELYRFMLLGTSSVMLSTLEDGKVVKGLAGIPSEGPVLFVGYHMFLGHDLYSLVIKMLKERDIPLRGMAHPLMFERLKDGLLPPVPYFDTIRTMGSVPVSGTNFFKLLKSKGLREACHRKGEEYKLWWPEQPEFVRMVAAFGAKVVPFGVVGEDDFAELVFDYDDQMKIPFFRDIIKSLEEETEKVRDGINDEVDQDIHLPIYKPKVPGRFYFYFGKPIETKGRREELKDKEKAQELYVQIKSEVDKCIAYLKEKRETDPYRSVLARIAYLHMAFLLKYQRLSFDTTFILYFLQKFQQKFLFHAIPSHGLLLP